MNAKQLRKLRRKERRAAEAVKAAIVDARLSNLTRTEKPKKKRRVRADEPYEPAGRLFRCKHRWHRMTKHLRRFKRCALCGMWQLRKGKKPLRRSLDKLPAILRKRVLPPVPSKVQHLDHGSEGYSSYRTGPIRINKRVRIWTSYYRSSPLQHYDIEVRLRRGWTYVGNVSEASWYRVVPHMQIKNSVKIILALQRELYKSRPGLSATQISLNRKK